MQLRELRPRQPFAGPALSAVAGIFLADAWEAPLAPLLITTCAAAAAAVLTRRTWVCLLFVATAFFALHAVRHHGSEAKTLADLLGPRPAMAQATGLVWSEPQQQKKAGSTVTCSFDLKLERLEVRGVVLPAQAMVRVRWPGPVPAYGDRVKVLGSIKPLDVPRNEGQFDYAAYLRRRGIHQEISARYAVDCAIVSHGHGAAVQRFAIAAQRAISRRLELDLQDAPEVSALIESMVLGLRGETPDDVKELFQKTGTMHLFAVSGLNVAMLAALCWFLLKPLRVSRGTAILLIVPLLAVYALVTGLSASCLRACIMGGMVLASYWFDQIRPLLPDFQQLTPAQTAG